MFSKHWDISAGVLAFSFCRVLLLHITYGLFFSIIISLYVWTAWAVTGIWCVFHVNRKCFTEKKHWYIQFLFFTGSVIKWVLLNCPGFKLWCTDAAFTISISASECGNGDIRRTVGWLRGGSIADSIDLLQGWYFNTLKWQTGSSGNF